MWSITWLCCGIGIWCDLRGLSAAVDGVVGEGAVGDEVLLEGCEDIGQVGLRRGGELEIAGDDEPADVVGAGLGEGLLRGVGVGCGVEEQDRELGYAAGCEEKGSSPGSRRMPSAAGISALVKRTSSSNAGM